MIALELNCEFVAVPAISVAVVEYKDDICDDCNSATFFWIGNSSNLIVVNIEMRDQIAAFCHHKTIYCIGAHLSPIEGPVDKMIPLVGFSSQGDRFPIIQ